MDCGAAKRIPLLTKSHKVVNISVGNGNAPSTVLWNGYHGPEEIQYHLISSEFLSISINASTCLERFVYHCKCYRKFENDKVHFVGDIF